MSYELILPFFRPIAALLLDEEISEIMGNPDSTWWVEREGDVSRVDGIDFGGEKLLTGLDVIAKRLQKKLDLENPLLNARLPDGSRLAAAIPPVVKPGPLLVIRKFNSRRFTIDDLIVRGTLTRSLAEMLGERIADGQNILISGGTGTGKTTLLNILARYIPDRERIVIIEDTSELNFQKPHVFSAECQADAYKSSVNFDDLLRGALRWRPDRIILGEVRGAEARTLLDSLNTGHRGSLATIHADSAAKALRRFATLATRSHQQSRQEELEAEIAECIRLVVHIERQPGRRFVREVIEVLGYDRPTSQFHLQRLYPDPDTGGLPSCTNKFGLQRIPASPTVAEAANVAMPAMTGSGTPVVVVSDALRCCAPDDF